MIKEKLKKGGKNELEIKSTFIKIRKVRWGLTCNFN